MLPLTLILTLGLISFDEFMVMITARPWKNLLPVEIQEPTLHTSLNPTLHISRNPNKS